MKILTTWFKGANEAERVMRSMPGDWGSTYQDGTIAACSYLEQKQSDGSSPDILLVKRPYDHTVDGELRELIECASKNGVRAVVFLSSRALVGRRQFVDQLGKTIVLELDHETWTHNIGVWEWEMILEHIITTYYRITGSLFSLR